MDKTELLRNFWVGTHYYRAPSPPPAEWEADLAGCRRLGMAFVQVRVFWRWHERGEGRYEWSELDEFMARAEASGCRVVFQICLENAPEYVFQKYDGYRVDLRGTRIWPISHGAFYAGGWIPCFDNPQVMAAALRFVAELARRYRNHPALAFYHAWNEPRCRPLGECACDHSIRSYREWLRERFKTVEAMNAFTGKCWGDFDQVDAARDTADYSDMHLWRQWGASRVAWRVREVYNVLKTEDPGRAVISHVGMSSIIQDPLADISDDVAMNEMTDLYGMSFPVRYEPEYVSFMLVDWMRCVGRGRFSVYELYPSTGSYFPELPAGLVEQWMWTAVAGGASGLCFWQYKKERLGVEINDAGLVETDGRWNETTAIVADTMAAIRKIADDLPRWKVPKASIALCYDLPSDLLDRIKFTRGRADDGNFCLETRCHVPGNYPYKGDLRGTYNLLLRAGFSCGFTTPRRWPDDLAAYRVVMLSCLQIVDEERAARLVEYVRNGGCLVVDAGFARRVSSTMLQTVRPGAGLAEAFGFREKVCVELNGRSWTMRFQDGLETTASFCRVEYEPGPETEVLATWEDGEAAVIRTRVGKGQVVAIGAYPGLESFGEYHAVFKEVWDALDMSFAPGADIAWREAFRRLFAGLGLAPENNCRDGLIERRMITPDNRIVHFLFRCYGGRRQLTDDEWKAVEVPGRPLVSTARMKIWETEGEAEA